MQAPEDACVDVAVDCRAKRYWAGLRILRMNACLLSYAGPFVDCWDVVSGHLIYEKWMPLLREQETFLDGSLVLVIILLGSQACV